MAWQPRDGDGPKLTRKASASQEEAKAQRISPKRSRTATDVPSRDAGKKPSRTGGGGAARSAPKVPPSHSKSRSGKRHAPRATLGTRFKRWLFSAKMLGRLASVALTLLVMGLVVVAWYSRDLPDIVALKDPVRPPGIQVLDARGQLIAHYGDIYGDTLRYEQFPKHLIDAVLATEDRNFFDHGGVDPWGILRAMFVNVRAGHMVQGGSTITQQLAKNAFLSADRTFKRKLQELILAFRLEAHYSKKQILTLYLNRVYLGSGTYGVDAASRYYFGHPATQLQLQESALLAGLLKAPSKYNPLADSDRSRGRAKQVLLNMVDAGKLSEDDAARAELNMRFAGRPAGSNGSASSRYFADWVVAELAEVLGGGVQEDVVVTTTLEPVLQERAEAAVAQVFTPQVREAEHAQQMALVAMRPDGAVVAMMGGHDYDGSEFNRAVQARRQPGSAFKVMAYVAAMEMGYTPDSMMEDAPIRIGKWVPKNYTGRYAGAMTLREAVAQSINTIAVRLVQEAGVSRVVQLARRLGVDSPLEAHPSIALGAVEVSPLELATVYDHFPSQGRAVHAFGIRKIVGRKHNEVLYQAAAERDTVVLAEDVVAKMNLMLSGVVGYGTGKAAALGRPVAGKTGTTSDYKDAWFAGYVPQLTTVVWVGNDDATPMKKVTGGGLPAKIWKQFMTAALVDEPVRALPTEYGISRFLPPWLGGGGNDVPQADALPSPQASQPKDTPKGEVLGKEFWNKLFDSDKIEYDYPSSNNR